ncbi:hypothetical protein SAMN06265370_101539 [Puniceibacterium sediminis]|uniref:Uncharacterized protein n=1 Tax=Puniceibacterium sediminis TaxID=1608407 RepID=A0A238V4W8_9RHOB|nr:hypothetical protein SAMN06265370_101539 [Puniceibacterium sediminis]
MQMARGRFVVTYQGKTAEFQAINARRVFARRGWLAGQLAFLISSSVRKG